MWHYKITESAGYSLILWCDPRRNSSDYAMSSMHVRLSVTLTYPG